MPLSQSPNSLPFYFKALHLMNKMIQSYHSHSQFIDHVKATKLTGFVLDLFSIAKAHFVLAEKFALSNSIDTISNSSAAFCIQNLNEIQEFAVQYQIGLLKIKAIGKYSTKIPSPLYTDLFEKAEIMKTLSRNVSLAELEKATDILKQTVNLTQFPKWLTFEFEQFLTVNNSLHVLFEKYNPDFDSEKTLLFYQNLDSLSLHSLIDDEEGDLAESCFSKLAHNDQLIEQIVDHFSTHNSIINPFSEKYSFTVQQNVNALFRLIGLLSTIGHNLFTNGFCNEHTSQETNQSSNNDDELKLQDGTGMGEGDTSESKNVSDRIEDESQVEGLRDETKQEPDKNNSPLPEDEDQAFEMEMDFDGDYQDKQQNDEEGAEDQQQMDDESEESDEVDETLGDHQNCNEFVDQLDPEFWEESSDEQETSDKTGDIDNFQKENEGVACNEDDDLLSKSGQESNDEAVEEEEQESFAEDDDSSKEQVEENSESNEIQDNEESKDSTDAEENVEMEVERVEEKGDDNSQQLPDEHSTKEPEQKEEALNSGDMNDSNESSVLKENFNNSFGNDKLEQKSNNNEGSGIDQASNSNLSNESNDGMFSNTQSSNNQLMSGMGASEQMQNMHDSPSQSNDNCPSQPLQYSTNMLPENELMAGNDERHESIPENQLFQQDESENSMQIQSVSQKHGSVDEAKFNSTSTELETESCSEEKLAVKSFSLLDQLKQTTLETSSSKQSDNNSSISSDAVVPMEEGEPSESLIKTPSNANLEMNSDPSPTDPALATESLPIEKADFIPASNSSVHQWELIENKILQFSCELCEQIFLILEPTMASRLKGSYKSGKQLDMKKIIPFIASDYKKDKIWLRRTKPATRKYQILISIDDSKHAN